MRPLSPLEIADLALRDARRQIEERDAEIANLREQIGGYAKDHMVERLRGLGLTEQEAALFAMLYDAKGRVLPPYAIEDRLPGHDNLADRSIKIVDVTVCKVRRKLGAREIIDTIWGRGYRLSVTGIALGDRIAASEPVEIHPRAARRDNWRRCLTAAQAREVKAIGYTEAARIVAARMGCSPSVVQSIRSGKRYQDIGAGA